MRLATKGRVPPTDGTSHWRFPVAPGVMLRAKGHQELVDVIFEYRLRNNLPIGDIVRDISAWYCAQWPKLCTPEASDTDQTAMRTNNEPILNRVARWASVQAHRMPRGGFPLVTPAVAESRAKVCVSCPRQDPGWKGGCGGCSATTLAILQQLKSLKRTVHDGSLGACGVMGWGNAVSVWLDLASLEITDAERAALPAACWRKDLP